METAIDLVIPWVDGSDPAWQQEKATFTGEGDGRTIRFRDWGLLPYVFRGIEQYLPWVRQVCFVTWGHLPPWLNEQAPRLRIVRHEDYIPEAYLPTFNSHTIELNLHRLPGLAEQFIYANDDMFFLQPLTRGFFFQKGLPVDKAEETPLRFLNGDIDHIIGNDLAVINRHFSKKETLRRHWHQWFDPKLGKSAAKNVLFSNFSGVLGFFDPHLPCAYRKSTFEAIWREEPDLLDATCRHRTRTIADVNQWVCRYRQLVTGEFVSDGTPRGRFFSIGKDDTSIERVIKERRCPMICLNDDDPHLDFEYEQQQLIRWFEHILPTPSLFER